MSEWLSYVERMDGSRLVKWYVANRPVGKARKRCIESEKEYLIERNSSTIEARRIVRQRNEWLGFVNLNNLNNGDSPCKS